MKTRPGDLAVWSLRTTHIGNGEMLSFPRWVTPEPGSKDRWPFFFREAKPDGDRIAVFVALGLDDHHHERYTEYLKTRKLHGREVAQVEAGAARWPHVHLNVTRETLITEHEGS